MVLDYLLRTRRIDVTHEDNVHKIMTGMANSFAYSHMQIGNTMVDIATITHSPALETLAKYHKAETVRAVTKHYAWLTYSLLLLWFQETLSRSKRPAASNTMEPYKKMLHSMDKDHTH